MTSPSDRFQLIDAPMASPGVCGVCGKSSNPKGFVTAVAPGLDFEFYGTLIFCDECIGNMARLWNYESPERVSDICNQLDALNQEVATLRQAVVLLENTVDTYANLGKLSARLGISSPDDAPSVVPSDEGQPGESATADAEPDRPTDEPSGQREDSESESDESVIVEGRDDVRDLTDLSEFGIDL